MKKVLIITYYWPPSGGAGVQRSLKFVKYLPDFGIMPTVLTVDPKVASYPAIDQSLLSEVHKDIKVVTTDSFEPLQILSKLVGKKRVPHSGFANVKRESFFQIALKFIRGNFFIPDARIGWNKYVQKKAIELITKEKIETVIISSPPHSSQLIGLELKKRFPSIKLIADLRDPWTDIYYYKELMHISAAAKKDKMYEKKVLETADEVIVVSEPIKNLFLEKINHQQENKFHVIPNGYDELDFKSDVKVSSEEFIVTYVGALPVSYKPKVFFKIISDLLKQSKRKIKLRFVGTLPTDLKHEFDESGIDATKVEFVGYVDHYEAVGYMQKASALLLIIPDVENSKGILTGKLFEYLGSGRPIIGIGPRDGSAAAILNECGNGKMFERNEEADMRKFIEGLINGQSLTLTGKSKNYSRRALTEKLAGLIAK